MCSFSVFLLNTMAEAPTTDMWIGLSSVNGSQFYWTEGQKKKYTTMSFVSQHYIIFVMTFNTWVMCCTTKNNLFAFKWHLIYLFLRWQTYNGHRWVMYLNFTMSAKSLHNKSCTSNTSVLWWNACIHTVKLFWITANRSDILIV